MPDYRCIKRLKTGDGVIHEIGTTVTLTGVEEQGALKQRAVVPMPAAAARPAPAQPTLAQLQDEEKQLQDQIATMEHEGGAPSA